MNRTLLKSLMAMTLVFAAFGATRAQASPVDGDRSDTSVVPAYSDVMYFVALRGGERTTIQIVSDGSTDLDVHVFDRSGKEIFRDTRYGDPNMYFTAPRTSVFKVVVHNCGDEDNLYAIDVW